MFNKSIELISYTQTTDEIGQLIESPSYKKVFAALKSVPQSEFFLAGQSSIRPECCFVVRTGEYKGERKLRYNGSIYTIYRYYDRTNEMTELYCEQRAGEANG